MTALPQALGRSRPRRRATKKTKRFALNGIGVIVALVTLFPILWMISSAFKPTSELFSLTPHPVPLHPTLGNFSEVMSGKAGGLGLSFWVFARNSLLVTIVTVVLASVVSLLAAVAVARFKFRFRASFLIMLLIVQMLPAQALV
ncbi:MAG TPA: carbohydrate ABC transporter permease, partial [Streptosporangiaceae bacterium]|nr:carbohydrate ABC transporter permease [Streptosporangiaceae bacterium]